MCLGLGLGEPKRMRKQNFVINEDQSLTSTKESTYCQKTGMHACVHIYVQTTKMSQTYLHMKTCASVVVEEPSVM
jgi:hypothetical protein